MVVQPKKKGKWSLKLGFVTPMLCLFCLFCSFAPSLAWAKRVILDIPALEIRTFGRVLYRTRDGEGVRMLARNNSLTFAAARYACTMAKTSYCHDVAQDGLLSSDRPARVGYSYCFIGENITAGTEALPEANYGCRRSPIYFLNYVQLAAQDYGVATATAAVTASSRSPLRGGLGGLVENHRGGVVGNGGSNTGPQYLVMLVGSAEC